MCWPVSDRPLCCPLRFSNRPPPIHFGSTVPDRRRRWRKRCHGQVKRQLVPSSVEQRPRTLKKRGDGEGLRVWWSTGVTVRTQREGHLRNGAGDTVQVVGASSHRRLRFGCSVDVFRPGAVHFVMPGGRVLVGHEPLHVSPRVVCRKVETGRAQVSRRRRRIDRHELHRGPCPGVGVPESAVGGVPSRVHLTVPFRKERMSEPNPTDARSDGPQPCRLGVNVGRGEWQAHHGTRAEAWAHPERHGRCRGSCCLKRPHLLHLERRRTWALGEPAERHR
mmetsp:Transcript_21160/g.55088  ORF Transcript_21160/g.55088 Transcript_21160/m.55088 type:complete len:277 (-) Transcript_21160:150-980(-)